MTKHPLRLFKFCPLCGSDNFVENNSKSKKCTDCQFIYYDNPSAAVVAIIENDKGEVLVSRRGIEPAKGTLDFPGGFADIGETIEDSVRREVKEETSLIVDDVEFLFSIPNIYMYSTKEIHTMDMFFRCRVDNLTHINSGDDVSELMFVPWSKLDKNDFGLLSIRKSIDTLKECRKRATKEK